MYHMLLYDHDRDEVEQIRDWAASIDNIKDELLIHKAESLQELLERLREIFEVSFYCLDFEAKGGEAVGVVKAKDESVPIIVIAGEKTPPTTYVRPSIMAAGLLLRPLKRTQVLTMFSEVLEMVDSKIRERLFNHEMFIFTTREGTIRIPYSQVLYFEARNKKIYLCTNRTEMDFYSTLDGIMKTLPDYFLRCHKGYIVNTGYISRVDLKENSLYMVGGTQLPISRSYREEVKEALLR